MFTLYQNNDVRQLYDGVAIGTSKITGGLEFVPTEIIDMEDRLPDTIETRVTNFKTFFESGGGKIIECSNQDWTTLHCFADTMGTAIIKPNAVLGYLEGKIILRKSPNVRDFYIFIRNYIPGGRGVKQNFYTTLPESERSTPTKETPPRRSCTRMVHPYRSDFITTPRRSIRGSDDTGSATAKKPWFW